MKIGILGKSEIAQRRFLPALEKSGAFIFAGFTSRDNGSYAPYDAMLDDPDIDALYIPLPPALHFDWARKALMRGKHVMLEKPFTTALKDTEELIKLAESRNLALHENYMFSFHSQLDFIRDKLPEIGELRLIRCDFGFPFRGVSDFRYDKALGGGALLDCGGYTLKLASILLGDSVEVVSAALLSKSGFDVDIGGAATLRNADGLTAQLCFGMDNSYRCSLDIWGSKGNIETGRIFTAPDGFAPEVRVNGETFTLPPDDSFLKSIRHFATLPKDYTKIRRQAELVEQFKERCI